MILHPVKVAINTVTVPDLHICYSEFHWCFRVCFCVLKTCSPWECAALPVSGISCFTWLSVVSQMAALRHLDHERTFYDAQKMKYLEMHFSQHRSLMCMRIWCLFLPLSVILLWYGESRWSRCSPLQCWPASSQEPQFVGYRYPKPYLAFDVGPEDLQSQHSYLLSSFPSPVPHL